METTNASVVVFTILGWLSVVGLLIFSAKITPSPTGDSAIGRALKWVAMFFLIATLLGITSWIGLARSLDHSLESVLESFANPVFQGVGLEIPQSVTTVEWSALVVVALHAVIIWALLFKTPDILEDNMLAVALLIIILGVFNAAIWRWLFFLQGKSVQGFGEMFLAQDSPVYILIQAAKRLIQ